MTADLATLRALKERRSDALLKATAMRFLVEIAQRDGDRVSVEVNCARGLAYLAEADRLDALISRPEEARQS